LLVLFNISLICYKSFRFLQLFLLLGRRVKEEEEEEEDNFPLPVFSFTPVILSLQSV
jgi:hypothetical protein